MRWLCVSKDGGREKINNQIFAENRKAVSPSTLRAAPSSEGAEKLFGNDLIYNAVDVIAYFRKIIVYFIIGNTQNNQVQVFKPLRANPVINCFVSIIVLRTVKFNNKSRFCEVFLPKEYLICCTVSYLHTPRQTILFSAFSHFTTFKNLS